VTKYSDPSEELGAYRGLAVAASLVLRSIRKAIATRRRALGLNAVQNRARPGGHWTSLTRGRGDRLFYVHSGVLSTGKSSCFQLLESERTERRCTPYSWMRPEREALMHGTGPGWLTLELRMGGDSSELWWIEDAKRHPY